MDLDTSVYLLGTMMTTNSGASSAARSFLFTLLLLLLLLLLGNVPGSLAFSSQLPCSPRTRTTTTTTTTCTASTSRRPQQPQTISSLAAASKTKKTATSASSLSSSSSSSTKMTSEASKRENRVKSLLEWAKTEAVGIRVASQDKLALKSSNDAGLGFYAATNLKSGDLLLQVPLAVALTVEAPGGRGPGDARVLDFLNDANDRATRNALRDVTPWYAQFALYLHRLVLDCKKDSNAIGGGGGDGADAVVKDYGPWLDSLPRQFDTPFHWSRDDLANLQYPYMERAVEKQKREWKACYDRVSTLLKPDVAASWTFDDFCWGCETARSRAFAGTSKTGTFDPRVYAFTLVLVAAYVGLGLGTFEQAANGAGVVFAATILKDFVLPKLASSGDKQKRYVICPLLDMANHDSSGAVGQVALEYFANGYSLALTSDVAAGHAVCISYGTRSNDQLLQYYGFVESNNPNDVYIMPPLREWPLEALEQATGRAVAPGRLEKLDRAGLLGKSSSAESDDEDEGEVANAKGGVVLLRTAEEGVDPAFLQALRALFSTPEEWEKAGEAVGNFAGVFSAENEACARRAAKTAVEMELKSKATTLEEDKEVLKRMGSIKNMLDTSTEEKLAVLFRIEKKKLLLETIDKLR